MRSPKRCNARTCAIPTSKASSSRFPKCACDLKIATAFVSPLGGGDKDAVIAALNRHARYIRGRVSPALRQMKYMPEFRFRLDTSYENFDKIDRLLKSPQVARDLGHEGGSDDENG
jgi:ribosome-binding factor A